ncbi:MAG: hypothetical protein N2234_06105 [Planctomycetota bacterium]|nr:hypothetical protein [Planctomycetota bacterium]
MRWLFLIVFIVCISLVVLGQEGREGESAKPWSELKVDFSRVTDYSFEYIERGSLWVKLEEYEGRLVRFIDELSVVWDQFAEYDYDEPGTPEEKGKQEKRTQTKVKGYKGQYDNQKEWAEDGYFSFETSLFPCIIDKNRKIPNDDEARKLYGKLAGSTYAEYLIALNQYPYPRGKAYKDSSEEERVREWNVRMEPKLIYVYAKVVRSVKFGRVTSEDSRSMGTKEEFPILVVWKVKPVSKEHIERISQENEEYDK